MGKFIMIIGNVGSGKSTYAQSLSRANPNFIRLNADKMRSIIGDDESDQSVNNIVFRNLENMANYLLSEGYSLIIDNLNYTRKSRKNWIKIAKKYLCILEARVMRTPYEVCIERNKNRIRVVPDDVLEKVFTKWEEPSLDEGFDEIIDIEYVETTKI